MTARVRILGASYGPEAIRAMLQAFDAVWASVHFHFYDSPEAFDAARLTLADAILLAASGDNQDVEQLKAAGLGAMAAHYHLEAGDLGLEAITRQRINNPKYWRSYAEGTAMIAEQMQDPECRRLLMGVSETYAELTRRALAAEEAASSKAATGS
jgi:hypothetical protein